MGLNVLVTGAAGYLGSTLCGKLLEAGFRVTAVDNLMYGPANLFHLCENGAFDFHRGDVRDRALMKRLLKDADAIVPLAAIVGATACDRDPWLAQAVNFDSVKTLLELRSPRQAVILPVTNSGYGTKSDETHCTEDSPLEPISLYGRTKVQAEAETLSAENTMSFRLATVFGMSPRMRLDLLVNHFVYTAVTDGYIVIFEKGFKRNYIHVRDVADCFIHGLNRFDAMKGRPYNVGLEDANLSKEELALKIKERVPNFFVHFSEIGSDPDKRNYIVSNQRLKEAGWEARRTLDDGIKELLKGYRMFGRGRCKNV